MPRTSKSLPFDMEVVAMQLVELGVQRKQFIKARIRVMNAAGALVRRALGWQPTLDDAESGKIAKQAAKIIASEDYDALPDDATVFLLHPVRRVTARIDCPSQRRWRIWARASLVNLFMLTFMLERLSIVNS